MSKIINLRRARKSAKRAEKRGEAERKSRKTGAARTGAAVLEAKRHEGHRLDRDD